MKYYLTALVFCISNASFCQSNKKIDFKRVTLSIHKGLNVYGKSNPTDVQILEPLNYLSDEENVFNINKEQYVSEYPLPIKPGPCIECDNSYKIRGFAHEGLNILVGYKVKQPSRITPKLGVAIYSKSPFYLLPERASHNSHHNGKLFFQNTEELDSFIAVGYSNSEDSTYFFPKVRGVNVRNPEKSYGLSLGFDYEVYESLNDHFSSRLEVLVNVMSTFRQATKIMVYNDAGLPDNYVMVGDVYYSIIGPAGNPAEYYQRNTVTLNTPPIRSFQTQVAFALEYRPIKKIPIHLGLRVGAGYNSSSRAKMVILSDVYTLYNWGLRYAF